MEKDDLKQLWQQENALQKMKGDVIDESIIRQKNCSAAEKMVRKQKREVWWYATSCIILMGVGSYLLLFKESPKTSLKLIFMALIFLFVLSNMIIEISVLRLMREITDSENIKESTLRLKQKLNRIKAFQFGMSVIVWWSFAIIMIVGSIYDVEKPNDVKVVGITLGTVAIFLPWLSKRNKRFKALFDKLDTLINYLNNG